MLGNFNGIAANIKITEPVGYLDFITLENSAKRIITDSGGIQKEAYILKKPCITLRTETEWVETVEEKWNLLLSPTDQTIASKINSFITPEKQNLVFGEDVTTQMVKIINSI
jgi:UDP-N-acetylglucosamine 2-epimerase